MKTTGIQLPHNVIKSKDENGNVVFKYLVTSVNKSQLKRIMKFNILTPAMVNYLKDYEDHLKDKDGKITDIKTLEKIRTILSKPKYEKDPIRGLDMRLPYQIERDRVAEEQKAIQKNLETENKCVQ